MAQRNPYMGYNPSQEYSGSKKKKAAPKPAPRGVMPGSAFDNRSPEDLEAIQRFLASIGQPPAPEGEEGPAETYDNDGGGGGGVVSYAPDPVLVAALARLNDVIAPQAGQSITDAENAWRMRLAQLQQMQQADNAAVQAQISGDTGVQTDAYNRAVDPILADLQAQGFTAAPIQQQAALDQQRMADYGQRQNDLSTRFAEIQNRSFADRDAAATGQMAGARSVLANNLAQMRAELEAQIAASTQGGGGGGGYGGGGGGGDAPISVLQALARANTPIANPLTTTNYAGPNAGFVKKAIGRVNDDLSNIGGVQRRFVNQARKKGLNKDGFVKRVKKQVFKPLKKAAPGYQKAKAKQATDAAFVEMWGQS
jgi:hypothetical protein